MQAIVETGRYLKGLMESGEFTPVIDRRCQLDQIVEAYRYVETGQKTGNVVISVERGDDRCLGRVSIRWENRIQHVRDPRVPGDRRDPTVVGDPLGRERRQAQRPIRGPRPNDDAWFPRCRL